MREFGYTYCGDSVFHYVNEEARGQPKDDDFFVYVMGPYTAFDATRAYDDANILDSPYPDDPLIDDEFETMEEVLGNICDKLCKRFNVRAYIATDVESIPTKEEAEDGESGMSVLDQSISFAAVSDAVIFILTPGGLTTGTGSEVGAILGEFNTRKENDRSELKPIKRFGIFQAEKFSSASIEESAYTYGVEIAEFEDMETLLNKIGHFLNSIEREEGLPVYNAVDSIDAL